MLLDNSRLSMPICNIICKQLIVFITFYRHFQKQFLGISLHWLQRRENIKHLKEFLRPTIAGRLHERRNVIHIRNKNRSLRKKNLRFDLLSSYGKIMCEMRNRSADFKDIQKNKEKEVKHEINRLRFSCDMITVGYSEGMYCLTRVSYTWLSWRLFLHVLKPMGFFFLSLNTMQHAVSSSSSYYYLLYFNFYFFAGI